MENFINYVSLVLALMLVLILVRAMQFPPKKERKNIGKRSVRDKILSVLLFLFFLAVPASFQLTSCLSDKEALSLYEGRWFSHGVTCCLWGLYIIASFFIAEKKLILFDMLKYATHSLGKNFMWFVSVWSIVWGLFVIIAPLLFDITVQKGRCFF